MTNPNGYYLDAALQVSVALDESRGLISRAVLAIHDNDFEQAAHFIGLANANFSTIGGTSDHLADVMRAFPDEATRLSMAFAGADWIPPAFDPGRRSYLLRQLALRTFASNAQKRHARGHHSKPNRVGRQPR